MSDTDTVIVFVIKRKFGREPVYVAITWDEFKALEARLAASGTELHHSPNAVSWKQAGWDWTALWDDGL
jgi:hypothetical protein